MRLYETIVIGGGQSGLAASYYLQAQNKDFIVLEAEDAIGRSWENRYDSLKLFTSARYNNLPGLAFPGNKSRFPSKDDVAEYLRTYAATFNIPVLFNQKVIKLSRIDGIFYAETEQERFKARNVIVCSGPFHKPSIPAFGRNIDPDILQLHSSEYKNPSQLNRGDVLVVGGGNSGVQIVEELLNHGKKVFFSFNGTLKSLANNQITQRLIFGTGITSASIHSFVGRLLSKRTEPIMGTNLLKLFSHPNVVITGRTFLASKREISCARISLNTANTIIWATGFKPDFSWIDLDVLTGDGSPVHNRGVSNVEGLFFLGLAWMHSRNSGLLGGVKEDAAFITSKIT